MIFYCFCEEEFSVLQEAEYHLENSHEFTLKEKGFIRIKHSYGVFHCKCGNKYTSDSCYFEFVVKNRGRGSFVRTCGMSCKLCDRENKPSIKFRGSNNKKQLIQQCYWSLQMRGKRTKNMIMG